MADIIIIFAKLSDFFLQLYMFIIIVRALISWFNPNPFHPIVKFLNRVTDPILYRIRAVIPPAGGLDLSPIVVIFVIFLIRKYIVISVLELGLRLKGGM
ncbi:MAG: YggT family protein [Desulfuromonadales bacterium]|nr:YggT family protein [Desulfuromonadales bacterium]